MSGGLTGKIIAYSGAHGVGKTTAVYAEAHRLKLENPSLEVGIVLSTARRCPLGYLSDGRQIIAEDSQLWIFGAQLLAELESDSQYDLVVSDRPIFDCIAYTLLGGHTKTALGMMHIARQYMGIYREVRLLSIADHDHLVADGKRNTNPILRERMEGYLIDIYHELGLPVTIVPPATGRDPWKTI